MTNNKGLWLTVGLAYLAFILIGANDGAFGVVLPSFQGFYSIDKSTVSIMFIFGTVGYLTSAFTSGLLVEKLGTHLFLTFGSALFVAGAGLMALALGFISSILGAFLISFGVGTIDAGLNAYIAGLPNNTSLLNYLHAFYGLGALLGPLVASGLLAMSFGWYWVYIVWVALGLTVMVGTWFFMKGEGKARPRGEAKSGGNVLAGALKLRVVWLAALFLLTYVGGEVSMGTWSYSLLTEERKIDPLIAGWTVSGFWMGLTLGRLLLGGVAKRLGDKMLIQACLTGVVVGLLLVWLPPREMGTVPNVAGAVGLWLTGFSLGPIFPTTIAVMARIVPERLLPSAIGFAASAGSIGAAFFPWVAGNLAQALGLWTLLPYVFGVSLLMLICWWLLQMQPGGAAQPERAGAEPSQ